MQIFNYTIQIYKFQQVLHIQAKDQVKWIFFLSKIEWNRPSIFFG